jgi:hypothetical protein
MRFWANFSPRIKKEGWSRMTEFLTDQNVIAFTKFFVPGILILFIRSRFINSSLPPISEAAVAYVLISIVYNAATLPVTSQWSFFSTWPGQALSSFIIPFMIGLLAGLDIRYDWSFSFFKSIGIDVNHPIPSAWDWKMSKIEPCYVMITLDDDTKWAGKFDVKSTASTDRHERDIYIEQVYDLDENNNWIARKSGVWINRQHIKSIEFW